MQQQAEAGFRAPADAPAQLVQLRQPEPLGMVDHHHAGLRHVHADLHHGCGNQQPDLSRREIRQRRIAHRRILLPMRQSDHSAEPGTQLGEPGLGGGDVQQLVLVHHRTHPVDPSAGLQLAGQGVQHVRHRRQRVQRGADGLPPRRLFGQAADIHLAPVGQQQGTGNRRRGHHQHIRAFALGAQGQALIDAEAVLLVDHRQRQIVIGHRVLEQRMGAHHDRDRPIRQPAQQFCPFASLHRPGQHRHRHRTDPRQHAMVLLHQHLGRRHQGRLRPGLHRPQHRHHGHQRLAGTDIALQQPQHPARRNQILVDLRDRLALGPRGRVAKSRQGLDAQAAIAHQLPPGPLARPPPDQPQGDLPGQQFVIGQPVAHARVGQGGRCLHRAQRLVEPGPFLPPQQRRVVPFRKFGHQCQRAAHRHRHLPRPQPGGQRPDRLDGRQPLRPVGRHHVVGVRDGQPVAVSFRFAGNQQLRPRRRLRLAGEFEEHQLRERGAVRDDHLPGLAAVGRRFVAHDVHRQGHDLSGLRLGDGRPGAAVQIRFRQVEQQIDHPVPAHRARQQRRQRRSYAGEPGQRREKRLQGGILHS